MGGVQHGGMGGGVWGEPETTRGRASKENLICSRALLKPALHTHRAHVCAIDLMTAFFFFPIVLRIKAYLGMLYGIAETGTFLAILGLLSLLIGNFSQS